MSPIEVMAKKVVKALGEKTMLSPETLDAVKAEGVVYECLLGMIEQVNSVHRTRISEIELLKRLGDLRLFEKMLRESQIDKIMGNIASLDKYFTQKVAESDGFSVSAMHLHVVKSNELVGVEVESSGD